MMKTLPFFACLVIVAVAPAQVLINECYTGTSDTLEIINFGTSPVSLTGWRIEYGGVGTNFVWVPGTFFFPSGTTLQPNQAAVLRENSTFPAIAPGALVFNVTQNINWATTTASETRGGGAVLVNASNAGVDMVHWYGNVPPNTFGATFSGTLNANNNTLFRNSRIDTNGPADWSFGPSANATFGAINPGQEQPMDELEVTLTQVGQTLTMSVESSFPAVPGGEIYNLISLQTFIPTGSGPLFGIGLDAIPELTYPADPNGLFHTYLDATGNWSVTVGGVPSGLHIEVVSIMLGGFSVERVSNVAARTL